MVFAFTLYVRGGAAVVDLHRATILYLSHDSHVATVLTARKFGCGPCTDIAAELIHS